MLNIPIITNQTKCQDDTWFFYDVFLSRYHDMHKLTFIHDLALIVQRIRQWNRVQGFAAWQSEGIGIRLIIHHNL